MKINIKKTKGFTIIELIVSLAIFFFIVGAAVTIFISIVQHQKRILSEQQLVSQVSYLEEYMSKALRMAAVKTSSLSCDVSNRVLPEGYAYLLIPSNPADGIYQGVRFYNQSGNNGVGQCQEFFWEDGVLKESKQVGNTWTTTPITSSDVKINSVRFGINGGDGTVDGQNCTLNDDCGAKSGDLVQPRVTIIMNIEVPEKDEPQRIIQTTVSQRNLNIPIK